MFFYYLFVGVVNGSLNTLFVVIFIFFADKEVKIDFK